MVSRGIARNTALNFVGQAAPLLIALAAMPLCAFGYGLERFALLGLVWTLLGYFAFLDFGFGRSTTKFIAEALGRDDRAAVPGILWVSLAINLALGILAGALIFLLIPRVIGVHFTMSAALLPEAIALFRLLALAVPAVTLTSALRGALEATGRFDVANGIKIPSNGLLFLLPLLGSLFGWSLPLVVALLVLSRYATVAVSMYAVAREIPSLLASRQFRGGQMLSLFRYGGWISVSNAVSPLLLFGERLLIGAVLPVRMLSFYLVPGELMSRLSIIPGSLAVTLFPRYSALGLERTREQLQALIVRPALYLTLLLTPIAAFFMFFAPEILGLWMGAEFAERGAAVLAMLASAFFFNALAHIPYSALQGLGRPDLPAKISLFLLLPFVALAWPGVLLFGLEGAAAAKTVMHLLEMALLFRLCMRTLGTSGSALLDADLRAMTGASLLFLSAGIACAILPLPALSRVAGYLVFTASFTAMAWTRGLRGEERARVRTAWTAVGAALFPRQPS